ncbi:MAG: 4Fe-4S dicluster domain-containing protein [Gammaproteobacteria bacterium]
MGSQQRTNIVELENHISALYHCADCSYCVDAVWDERDLEHVCPTLAHHSPALGYSGRGYISLARAVVEGEEFPLADMASRVFTCTSCGNCDRACPIGLSPRSVNLGLRELLVNQQATPSVLKNKRDRLLNAPNIQYLDENEALASIPSEATLDIVDTLFLPGCTAAASAPGEVAASYRLINEIAPNAAILGAASGTKSPCCGAALAELGFRADAARSQQQLIAQTGLYPRLKHVIHLSSQCNNYGDRDPRAMSFAGWLCNVLSAGEATFSATSTLPEVVCLNSCQGRNDNEILERLFAKLQISSEYSNFQSRYSMCCGAAGGMPEIEPDAASRMACSVATNAADQANEPVLVVPDPVCLGHIQRSLAAGEDALRVLGLGEFLTTYFAFHGGSNEC